MTPRDDAITDRDPQLDAAADRLNERYAGNDGPFTRQDVAETVHDAAQALRDAPVQTFVPLLAEHKARSELHEREQQLDG